MKNKNRFTDELLATINKDKILGIRAGKDSTHRVIGIWSVVVSGRVFVRSWSLKPRSWWRTFLEDPRGIMTIGTRRFSVRAVQRRGARLNDAVSRAYLEKYDTPGALKFVKDMSRAK